MGVQNTLCFYTFLTYPGFFIEFSRSSCFRGSLGTFLGLLVGSLGFCWVILGCFCCLSGASWASLRSPLAPLGTHLGVPEPTLTSPGAPWAALGPPRAPLGAPSGALRSPLGFPGGPLVDPGFCWVALGLPFGATGLPLGFLGVSCGRPLAPLGIPWDSLGRLWALWAFPGEALGCFTSVGRVPWICSVLTK